MKIKIKVFLLFVIFGLALTAGAAGIFYRVFSRSLKSEIAERLRAIAVDKASDITNNIASQVDLSRMLNSRADLRQAVSRFGQSHNTADKKSVSESIGYVKNAIPGFVSITVADPQGKAGASTDPAQEGQNFAHEQWFKEGQTDYKFYINTDDDAQSLVYLSGPLIMDDKLLGVTLIRSQAESISAVINDYTGLGQTGETYLVDQQGYLILPSRFEKIVSPAKQINTINSQQCLAEYAKDRKNPDVSDAPLLDKNYRGVNTLGVHTVILGQEWCLLAEIDRQEAFQEVDRMIWYALAIAAGAVVAIFFIARLVSNFIARPIEKLRHGVEIVDQGNLGHRVAIKSKDEIGDLSRAFDRMVLAIKKSRAEIDRKVEEHSRSLVLARQKLERQKKDIFNILKDVEAEREKTSQERDRTNAILYGIGDGIIVTDKHGRVEKLNVAAVKMLGWPFSRAHGKKIGEFFHLVDENGREVPAQERPIAIALATGEKVTYSLQHTHYYVKRDGTKFPAGITVTPYLSPDKRIIGAVEVFRDITMEKNIDQAKSEFVSLASHQLRTPLTSINWYAEMLLAGDVGKLQPDQKDYLKQIYAANRRMVELVNALLNVSRIELGTLSIEPKNTDLKALAESVINELKPQIMAKKLVLKSRYQRNLPQIKTDPKLARIVFQNLISNAVKYTPPKGRITVTITPNKAKTMVKAVLVRRESLLIEVKDNGYGIPESQQSKIFTKLFRADNVQVRETEGTGLGLYIVKAIVKNAGGQIWFESKENKGTTFYVTMPLSGMPAKAGTKTLT